MPIGEPPGWWRGQSGYFTAHTVFVAEQAELSGSEHMNEKELGERVKALRGSTSQAALGHQMQAAGFAWSQAAVWGVESGARKLTLLEAVKLAEIFGVSLAALTSNSDEASLQRELTRAQEAERAGYESYLSLMGRRAEVQSRLFAIRSSGEMSAGEKIEAAMAKLDCRCGVEKR